MSLRSLSDGFVERLSAPGFVPFLPYVGVPAVEFVLRQCYSRPVLIYIDPDVDGLVAARFYRVALTLMGVPDNRIFTYINTNRQHGFSLNPADVSGFVVLCGDFHVSSEQVRDLVAHDVSIVSIDHHECQSDFIHWESNGSAVVPGSLSSAVDTSTPFVAPADSNASMGVVVNNQYPFQSESNRFQSGAGVVFEVLAGLFPALNTVDNRALVGVTILTDIRDVESPGAWYWLWECYHAPYEGFIRYLVDSVMAPGTGFSYGYPKLDRNFVVYTLSPKVNALLRFNGGQEAVDLFLSGGGYPEFDYRHEQRKLVELIKVRADIQRYSDLAVVEIPYYMFPSKYHDVLSNFIGYACSSLMNDVGTSVIGYTVTRDGTVTRASFRGLHVSGAYKSAMASLLPTAGGHEMAFGIPGLQPSASLWEGLNRQASVVDAGSRAVQYVVEVPSIWSVAYGELSVLAERNGYRRSENMVGFRVREPYRLLVSNSRLTRWEVSGVEVLSFDPELTLENGVVVPHVVGGSVS